MSDVVEKEQWRWVPGYEGHYKVSSAGRVWSVSRHSPRGAHQLRVGGRVLSLCTKPNGYLYVNLRRDGGGRRCNVHRLVAAAFIGPAPAGHDVRHLDGDRTNNSVANLSYGTRAENMADARRHGTLACGRALPQSKLSPASVRHIRSSGLSDRSLAEKFGVNPKTIKSARLRNTWRHVE